MVKVMNAHYGGVMMYEIAHILCIIDASGKRISDLSEPLAQAKFSIFYMSTYQTDFVLVSATHFLEKETPFL